MIELFASPAALPHCWPLAGRPRTAKVKMRSRQFPDAARHLVAARRGPQQLQGSRGGLPLENVLRCCGRRPGKGCRREAVRRCRQGPDAVVSLPQHKPPAALVKKLTGWAASRGFFRADLNTSKPVWRPPWRFAAKPKTSWSAGAAAWSSRAAGASRRPLPAYFTEKTALELAQPPERPGAAAKPRRGAG